MGEKIRDVYQIEIKGRNYQIELNAPVDDMSGGIVHIQSDDLRMEFSQSDFYKLVGHVILAKAQLDKIKGD